jgi:hypothetical protein
MVIIKTDKNSQEHRPIRAGKSKNEVPPTMARSSKSHPKRAPQTAINQTKALQDEILSRLVFGSL